MSHIKPKSFTQKKQSYFEITNSISWLLMDACWMFEFQNLSYLFIAPTVISSIVLVVKINNPNIQIANGGLLVWVLMNVIWMISDYLGNSHLLLAAKILFPVGLLIILIALYRSQNKKEILNNFRRFHKIFKKG